MTNHYNNPNSFHLCFPITVKKNTNNDNDIDDDLITVSNFFIHWVKEINVTRYGDHVQILATSSPYDEFTILAHGNKKYLLEIKESLLTKRDQPVLNKNISSTPLHLFDTV